MSPGIGFTIIHDAVGYQRYRVGCLMQRQRTPNDSHLTYRTNISEPIHHSVLAIVVRMSGLINLIRTRLP